MNSRSPRTFSRSPRRFSRSVDKRDTVDLLQRGLALAHGLERRLAQRARAVSLRRLLELPDRRARDDQLADLVVQDQQLRDRLAALEAGAAALAAARGLARRTDHAHQALRED